jgi:uncharacterized protein (TIGR03437 family)
MRTAKLLILLTLLGSLLLARNDRGTITGNVVNPEGIVRIEATSMRTGERFTSVADSTGGFTLGALPPGSYGVIIRNEKGTAFARQYLKVRAGEAVRLEAKLEAVRPPRADGTRSARPHGALIPTTDLPPVVQQFGESSRYLNAVVLVDDSHGWAVGDPRWDQATHQTKGSIVNTTDGGVTWSNQDPGVTVSLNGLFFVNATQGWAVGDGGTIVRTTDGGAHWTRQAVATGDSFSSVFFADALNGWATSSAATQYDMGDVVGWRAGMWHSTDGGQTWSPQNLPANASLLKRVFFVNLTTGFAAGAALSGYDAFGDPTALGAIYGTTDGGHTWNQIYTTSDRMTLTSLHFTDASNGWAAGFPHSSDYAGGCGFHTADGGKTWQPQSLNPEDPFLIKVRDLRMVDGNRGYAVGTAYAGVGGGTAVWRTLDGGATWTGVTMQDVNPLTMEGFWGLAVTAEKVLIVGDRDLTANSTNPWNSCVANAGNCEGLFTQAYLSPHYMFEDIFFTDKNHGWAAGTRTFSPQLWGQEIFATQDGGQTWASQFERALTSGSSSHLRLDSISFADANNGWASGSSEAFPASPYEVQLGCIVHTADGGKTWTDQAGNICTYSATEYSVIQALDAQNVWALSTSETLAGNVQLAHTTDGGSHWSLIDTGIPGFIAVGYGNVQGGMRFVDAQHGCFAGNSVAGCTGDGGAHWTPATINCGYPTCYIDANTVALADSAHAWFGGSGLYQSGDNGADWSPNASAPIGNDKVEAIQFLNASTGWLAGTSAVAGTNALLLETTDAGAHWQSVDPGTSDDLLGLSFVDPTHGWIVGDYGTILSYAGDRNPAGMPAVFATVNAASYAPETAPAAWISIFGANLSATSRGWTTADFVGNNLPTKLDGVSVLVNGSPAYLSYVSPGQINAMIPDGTPAGQVSVQVTNAAGSSGKLQAQAGVYSPALFRLGGDQHVIVQNAQMQLTSTVKPGDTIVLYGTGFGPTNPPTASATVVTGNAQTATPVTFTIGGIQATVKWAGIIAGAGLYQFNIQVPAGAVDGDLVITAGVGGAYSQGDSLITVSQY